MLTESTKAAMYRGLKLEGVLWCWTYGTTTRRRPIGNSTRRTTHMVWSDYVRDGNNPFAI